MSSSEDAQEWAPRFEAFTCGQASDIAIRYLATVGWRRPRSEDGVTAPQHSSSSGNHSHTSNHGDMRSISTGSGAKMDHDASFSGWE